MVSDADGKNYPWYGAENEVMQVRGPTQLPTPATISMHDTFHPQVWLLYAEFRYRLCCDVWQMHYHYQQCVLRGTLVAFFKICSVILCLTYDGDDVLVCKLVF